MEKELMHFSERLKELSRIKTFGLLLLVANLLYLFFIFSVFHYDVPMTDDFGFISNYKKAGMIGAIRLWYLEWQGRFLPQLITSLTLWGFEQWDTFLFYPVIFLGLFIYAAISIFKQLDIQFESAGRWGISLLWNLAAFLFGSMILFHFDISSFFWITVSPMYFGGVLMWITGVGALISDKTNISSYLVTVLAFFYVGCSAEHVGVLSVMWLGVLLIYQYFFANRIPFSANKKRNSVFTRKVLFAFIACLLSFVIMYLAPGNEIRQRGYPPPDFINAIKDTPAALYAFLMNRVSMKLPFAFMVFFIFAYGGVISQRTINLNRKALSNLVWVSFSVTAITMFLTVFLFHYAMGDDGPTRALAHITFLFVAVSALLGYYLGVSLRPVGEGYLRWFALASIFAYILLGYHRITFHLPDTKAYSKAVKGRLHLLDSLNKQGYTGTYVLPRIPIFSRNVLHCDEMSSSKDDVLYWINRSTRDALQLKFDILVEKGEPGFQKRDDD